jgi:hypothetical protein
MIGAVTAGRVSSQARANVPGSAPISAARALVALDLLPVLGQALGGASLDSADASIFFFDHPAEWAALQAVTKG